MSRSNRFISLLTALLVAFLAGGAFWLSFDALRHLAIENGVTDRMAWLYPAIIDGAIIVFSLSVLLAGLNRERTLYPWTLVGLFTLLSVVLNIVHAPGQFLARGMAAIPPVALFLSFELLMTQIRTGVERSGVRQTLADLDTAVRARRGELDDLHKDKQTELDAIEQRHQDVLANLAQQQTELEAELARLAAERAAQIETDRPASARQAANGTANRPVPIPSRPVPANGTQPDAARPSQPLSRTAALDVLLTYLDDHPDASLAEVGTAIGRSKSTAGVYVNELQATGRLHRNGHGWEVLDDVDGE